MMKGGHVTKKERNNFDCAPNQGLTATYYIVGPCMIHLTYPSRQFPYINKARLQDQQQLVTNSDFYNCHNTTSGINCTAEQENMQGPQRNSSQKEATLYCPPAIVIVHLSLCLHNARQHPQITASSTISPDLGWLGDKLQTNLLPPLSMVSHNQLNQMRALDPP